MNQQLRNLLVAGSLLGAGYLAYNYYTDDTLSLNFTRKIAQQIKHQILIVTINFAAGSKEGINKLKASGQGKAEQLVQYFTSKMAEIYDNKENLILDKYHISKEKFRMSLEKYKNDTKLKMIQNQIIQMMEKSVRGEVPDLTIDKKATASFTKDQIKKIYEEMSKMILVSLVAKFQAQKKNNPHFDTNNDAHFKKAIRQLNIYDKKIDFFKSRGFKEEWGCPNETFFKLSQSLKLKDANFKQQMARLQKTYEQIVDIAAKDPLSISIQKINDYYTNQALLKRDLVQQQEADLNADLEQEIQQINNEPVHLARSAAEVKRPKLGVEQLIKMNRSTRSEPEHDEIIPIPEVSNSAQQSDEPAELAPRSKSVKQPSQLQKIQQKEFVENVPNDAKQFQKHIEAQLKQNEQKGEQKDKKQQLASLLQQNQPHQQHQHHQHHEENVGNKQQAHIENNHHAQQVSVSVSQADSNMAVHEQPINQNNDKKEENKQQEHQGYEHHQV